MTAGRWLARLLLGAAVLLTVGVVAVPNTTLAWLREDFRWVGQSVNWVEALWPGWDSVHLLLFGALGFLAGLALPRWPLRGLLAGLLAFSALTEAVQFWVPGRTPLWSDFGQNVLGAVVGLALALGWLGLWAALSGRRFLATTDGFDG